MHEDSAAQATEGRQTGDKGPKVVVATFAGILGIALFWQWVYVSSLYAVSFRVAGSHEGMPRSVRWTCVWGPNAVWIVVPLLGLFVSARPMLDGTYGIVGH